MKVFKYSDQSILCRVYAWVVGLFIKEVRHTVKVIKLTEKLKSELKEGNTGYALKTMAEVLDHRDHVGQEMKDAIDDLGVAMLEVDMQVNGGLYE